MNNFNEQSNNDRSSSSNKCLEDENIEAKGIEINFDFKPIILKKRDFSKIRLPVLYTKNSIKLSKYFTIQSQLNQNPNYDFSLSSSDLDEKPISPSMMKMAGRTMLHMTAGGAMKPCRSLIMKALKSFMII